MKPSACLQDALKALVVGTKVASTACLLTALCYAFKGVTGTESPLYFCQLFPRELRVGQLITKQGCRSPPEHAGSQQYVFITSRRYELFQSFSCAWAQVKLHSCSVEWFCLRLSHCRYSYVTLYWVSCAQIPGCAAQKMVLRLC